MRDTLTSARVATLLGVTTTTVKRWAKRGLLPSSRTAGGHRRFRQEDVESLRKLQSAPDPVEDWIGRLLGDRDRALLAALLAERARLGAWWQVADELGPVLLELGRSWETGRIAPRHEHRASERLSRALARACEPFELRPGAPRAVLSVPEGESHTLGLSFVELVVREHGWGAIWIGARTPTSELEAMLDQQEAGVILLSASTSSSPEALADTVRRLAPACARSGALLLAGGMGPWPDVAPPLWVERTFAGLHSWMTAVDRARDMADPRRRRVDWAAP